MKEIKIFIFGLPFFIVLIGCLSDEPINVNQDHLWTHYEFIYDAHQDSTQVKVQFRFKEESGTLLKILDPAYITFNDQKLIYNPDLSAYTLKMYGISNEGTFVFTDADRNQYINQVNLTKDIKLPMIENINTSEDIELNWQGDPVGVNEAVNIFSTSDSNDIKLATQSNLNSNNIVLAGEEILSLNQKTIDLMIDRVKNLPLQNSNTAGGYITSTFRDCQLNIPVN